MHSSFSVHHPPSSVTATVTPTSTSPTHTFTASTVTPTLSKSPMLDQWLFWGGVASVLAAGAYAGYGYYTGALNPAKRTPTRRAKTSTSATTTTSSSSSSSSKPEVRPR